MYYFVYTYIVRRNNLENYNSVELCLRYMSEDEDCDLANAKLGKILARNFVGLISGNNIY